MAPMGGVTPRDIEEQLRRYEAREMWKLELRAQRREFRIWRLATAWLFMAFVIVFLNAEMIRAVTVIGFLTAFVVHLFAWKVHSNVCRELGEFQ